MKRHIIFFSSILTFLVLGCTDLEEHPVNIIAPETYFKDAKSVETGILGTYGFIASEAYWGRKYTLTVMLLSDMVDIGNRGTAARRIEINDFTSNPYNGMVAAFWPRSYQIISAANYAIQGGENLIAQGVETESITKLVAEGKFVRALIYFNLVRMFSDIPYIGEAITDPNAVKSISKTSVEDVYQNIIADLEYATQNLDMTPAMNSRSRPSKGSAYTMLADVYLTLGNYQEAYDNAKWVIDNASSLDFALEPDFQDLFDATKQDATKEHIFSVDFLGLQVDGDSEGDDLMGPLTGIPGAKYNGWDVAVPSLAVFTTWDSRDYRRKVSFEDSTYIDGVLVPYTEYQGTQRPHIAKYFRYPGNSDGEARYSDNNYAVYRYAEVLLTAAEALNEVSGPTEEAIGYVNQVRARARNWAGHVADFPADVQLGINKDDFRDLVLDERRLELAFEFKRWYDIQRRKMGEEIFKGTNSLEPHLNFNPDIHYLLALPQPELDRNPNLLPQNPGY